MLKEIYRRLSVYSTIGWYYFRRLIRQHPWLKKSYHHVPGAGEEFRDFLRRIPADKLFVHTSLSAVNRFTDQPDKYAFLMQHFWDHFSVIASQAFTPQVRKTRVYDPLSTKPAYGAFAKTFFQRDAGFRNLDPCYSVMASGHVAWDEKVASFASNGVFQQMVNEEFYCLNIGLDHVTCSLMHYVEYQQQVPYLQFGNERFRLVLDGKEHEMSHCLHQNKPAYSVKGFVWWNKRRLMQDLKKTDIVQRVTLHDVRVYAFSMRALYLFVSEKVKKDPFYLISW